MAENNASLFFDGRKDPLVYLKRHPVLITFVIVVLLSTITFCEQNYITAGNIYFALAGLCLVSLIVSIIAATYFRLKSVYAIILFFFLCTVSYLTLRYLYSAERKAAYIFIVGVLATIIIAAILAFFKKMNVERAIILLFAAGLLLRLMYVLYTSKYTRQHDVGNFGEYYGHAGYIHYIFEYGHLPDFDVSTVDQFYHPPLHHIIAAVFWKILSLIGIADAYSQSAIQTLTLFYSCVCMILSYKIFVQLKVRGAALVGVFAIIAFHPTFVIFAGSINNDILSVTFMLLAVLYSIKWYRSRSFKDIIIIALAVGFGMMTKTSAYMVAFGIGFLFLFAMLKDKKNMKKYIVQFACFAVVCVPLALWWNIKNSIQYNLPLAYVQRQGEGSRWQYVGDHSFFERMFDFSKLFNAPVFDQWTNRGGKVYNDYNPLISLLKTSMFGEYINDYGYPSITFAANALFWSNFALAVFGVGCLVYAVVRMLKRKEYDVSYISIMITYVLMVMFYYIFCFSYPHHCTENIRYVSPVIVCGALFIGRTISDLNGKSVSYKAGVLAEGECGESSAAATCQNHSLLIKVCSIAAFVVIAIFCVSSATMFLQIGLA